MVINYNTFKDRCDALLEQVTNVCVSCGREPRSVKILAVTKTHPLEAALNAYEYGLWGVGENRIQEAIPKIEACSVPLRWELIGHLQGNKAKLAVNHFNRIQSIDSDKLLSKVNLCAKAEGKVMPVLLQVNAGNDPAKFGVEMEEAPRLLEHALTCDHIAVEGLMTIAPLAEDAGVARKTFANLRLLQERLTNQFDAELPELSMGMSGDFESAIREGSTLIRVGSMLFGSHD